MDEKRQENRGYSDHKNSARGVNSKNRLIDTGPGASAAGHKPYDEEDYKDENGKIDINEAPVNLVVDKGIEMQYNSVQAVKRIGNKLGVAEDIAVETKAQLREQNNKLMQLDEKLT